MSFKIPVFPLVSAAASALGLLGLVWYRQLSAEDKANADALSADYARRLYGCTVNELTEEQSHELNGIIKSHVTGC